MDNQNEKPKEDFIKSYEKIFDYVNDELKNDEENLNKQKIQYDTN